MTKIKILLLFLLCLSNNTFTKNPTNNADIGDISQPYAQPIEKNGTAFFAANAQTINSEIFYSEQNVNQPEAQIPFSYKKYGKCLAWATVAFTLHRKNEPQNYVRTTFIPKLIEEQIEEAGLNKVFFRKQLYSNTYFEVGVKEIAATLYTIASDADGNIKLNDGSLPFTTLKCLLVCGIKMPKEKNFTFEQALSGVCFRTCIRAFEEKNTSSSFVATRLMYELGYAMLCTCTHTIFEKLELSEYLEPVLPKNTSPESAIQHLVYTILTNDPIKISIHNFTKNSSH